MRAMWHITQYAHAHTLKLWRPHKDARTHAYRDRSSAIQFECTGNRIGARSEHNPSNRAWLK
eukprot:2974563-Alexandrium_andersonii.AAC.1